MNRKSSSLIPPKPGLFRLLLLAIVCLITSACTADTPAWKVVSSVFPSQEYQRQLTDHEDGLSVCLALEERGYQFDQFYVDEFGVELTFPGRLQRKYPQDYSVSAVVLTWIARDYESAEGVSDEELKRLDEDAVSFCRDYQQTTSRLGVNLQLSGILYWDYINGVRVGYHFSEACEIQDSYGLSFGSYAYRYAPDPDATCPSGHVEF